MNIFSNLMEDDPTEVCWQTGQYNDDCICDLCIHKYECGGYEGDDD